jgi:hypothetical protein
MIGDGFMVNPHLSPIEIPPILERRTAGGVTPPAVFMLDPVSKSLELAL